MPAGRGAEDALLSIKPELGALANSFCSRVGGRRVAGGTHGKQQHLPITACSGRADPSALPATAENARLAHVFKLKQK